MSLRAIMGKEVRDLWREKTLLVAIVVQLFVAGFSTFLLVGLQAVTDPETASAPEVDVAYVGPGGFDRYLGTGDLRRVDAEAAMELWRQGRVDVVVEERVDDVRHITLLFAEGDPVAALHVTYLKGLLQDYEQDLREARAERLLVEPLALPPAGDDPPVAFAYATLLPLLVLVPVFLSGSIAGDTFSQEIQDRTMLLLRSAPVRPATIVLGKLGVAVMLAPAQVALWLLLFAWNGFPVAQPGLILTLATGLAAVLAAVGVAIAVWVRQEGMTQAVYAAAAIALGAASLALPRDPLNAIALLSVGADAGAWWTVGITASLGVFAVTAVAWSATRAVSR